MNTGNKYDILLFEESKIGRKNSFINLSNIYIYRVFSVVFKLVPIKDEAIKISAETFLVTWRNISNITDLNEFCEKLDQIAYLRSIDYLNKNELKTLDSNDIKLLNGQFNNPISEIEKDIIGLPTNERVVVVLSDQLGLTANMISRIYNRVQKKEIPSILNKTRKQLIITRPSEYFFKYSEKQWDQLYSNIKKIEKFSILDLTTEQEEIIKEYYYYSKELMQDLFMSILPNQEIKDILRNYILDEQASAAVKEIQIIAETDVLATEKLIKKHKPNKQFASSQSRLPKVSLSIIFLVIAVYLIFTFIKFPTTWNISNEFIHTVVNGANATRSEVISGDIIKTDRRQTEIENSENTKIDILENSELKVSEITGSENIFELKKGGIKFNTEHSSVERYFKDGIAYKINNSLSKLETINSQFIFEYLDFNRLYLNVKYGWVKLTTNKDNLTIYCVSGYTIKYNKSFATAVPFRNSSNEKYIEAVEQISKSPNDGNAFSYIIRNSTERDALTLWHLLETSDAVRQNILIDTFDKLLLLDLKTETQNGAVFTSDSKLKILKFIRSSLLMRS